MSDKYFPSDIDFSDAAETIRFDVIGRELSCYFYPVDQDPPVNIGKLRKFYNIWNDDRKLSLPSWKDFKFEQFAGWHSLMRVMSTGGSINAEKTNIIMGSEFESYWGTKTFKAQIDEGLITDKNIIKSYEEYHNLLHSGHFVFNVGVFKSSEGGAMNMIMIDLPLSETGNEVSHLMGAFIRGT